MMYLKGFGVPAIEYPLLAAGIKMDLPPPPPPAPTKKGKGAKVHIDDLTFTHYVDKPSFNGLGDSSMPTGQIVITLPPGQMPPLPAPIDPSTMPPGWCGGPMPGWQCPQYAVRNAVVGSAVGAVLGGFLNRGSSKSVGAMAGASFFGLLSWYLFSGRWWV